MNKTREAIRYNMIFILFFFLTTTLLHLKSYNKLPTGVSASQQSDHYALALGFLDDGFDFFHPSSFALSNEFPPIVELKSAQGITAVDFPILHYTVAILMKLFNTRSPVIFRVVSLLWSFIALWFLFSTIKNIKGFWIAAFLSGFIMFQPIYCYYQNGFHVSSAAFNTFLIGATFILRFFHKGKNGMFIWGVLFLTLAALMRFTQIISLLALLCTYLYVFFKKRMFDKKLLIVLFGIILVLGYFAYNQYLRSTYGSIFLGEPRLAKSYKTFMNHLLGIGESYLKEFIPFMHLFALTVIIFLFKKENNGQKEILQNFMIWGVFSFIGTLIFSLIMSFGLYFHDYYSLDTWLPVMTLAIIYLVYSIDTANISYRLLTTFVIMFLIGSFSLALEKQLRKYDSSNIVKDDNLVLNDFKESINFLNSNVSGKDKVLIISNFGWNTPMIAWQRKSYRVGSKFDEKIPQALEKGFDIIITHNAYFQNIVVDNYPEFSSKVQFIDSNGKVSIWKLNNR